MKPIITTSHLLNLLYSLLLTSLMIACTGGKAATEKEEEKKENKNLYTVKLSKEEYQTIDIAYLRFQNYALGELIKANGRIDIPPQGIQSVHAPIQGYVLHSEILPGEYVTQGQVLATLQHPDYLTLQEEYLKAKHEIIFLAQELERQKTLQEENISATKNLQKTQMDYNIAQSRKTSLEQRLLLIGINPNQVQPDKFVNTIAVTAKISGFVKSVNINIGKLVNPQEPMFEINSDTHKHVELSVFEKDIYKIQKGQKVIFQLANDPKSKEYEGEVFLVGKHLDPTHKTLNIHVHIKDATAEKELTTGMFVSAYIITSQKEQPYTITEEAIIKEGNYSFIFIETQNNDKEVIFEKIPIQIIEKKDKLVSLKPLKNLSINAKVVGKGNYYLQAYLNNASEEE
ncbi:MAG: efflux RND transporter periplasmic adaptor subunit [Cytophagales bacterium]|nr:MAG: efflux RND transporter periplasmic adaptor subunit [Cytophagales bacterium]